jgi:hypothetical protein
VFGTRRRRNPNGCRHRPPSVTSHTLKMDDCHHQLSHPLSQNPGISSTIGRRGVTLGTATVHKNRVSREGHLPLRPPRAAGSWANAPVLSAPSTAPIRPFHGRIWHLPKRPQIRQNDGFPSQTDQRPLRVGGHAESTRNTHSFSIIPARSACHTRSLSCQFAFA